MVVQLLPCPKKTPPTKLNCRTVKTMRVPKTNSQNRLKFRQKWQGLLKILSDLEELELPLITTNYHKMQTHEKKTTKNPSCISVCFSHAHVLKTILKTSTTTLPGAAFLLAETPRDRSILGCSLVGTLDQLGAKPKNAGSF